jgi:uncharacterized protein
MNKTEVIKRVEDFAKSSTEEFDSGHDWWHLNRVRNMALHLQKIDNKGDKFIIELGALLHDVNDKKFRKKGSNDAGRIISDLLEGYGLDGSIIHEVILINTHISFSSGDTLINKNIEFEIVQDADRLDAIGAIGIARAFNYGGFKNNAIYLPESEPSAKNSSTIGHFYEKLLLLRDMMNTPAASIIASERHKILEQYLEWFYFEWDFSDARP